MLFLKVASDSLIKNLPFEGMPRLAGIAFVVVGETYIAVKIGNGIVLEVQGFILLSGRQSSFSKYKELKEGPTWPGSKA